MELMPSHPTKRMMMNDSVETLFDTTSTKVVGKPLNRVDGPLKVTGQATYSAEFKFDDMVYGVLVGATIAKGSVDNIDTHSIDDIAGIIKVVTDPKQFIRHSQQGGKTKAPTQGVAEVTYIGQPIAAVIADSFEAAMDGARSLKVTYKDETDEAALDFHKEYPNKHAVDESSGSDKSSKIGDPEKGLEMSAVSLDKTYSTPSQSNSPMEPHATIAYWEGDKLVLHTSNQMLAPSKKQVADALNLDEKNVQLISKYVGGGFGSKLGIAPESIAAALSAKELKRPVRIVMTRPQVIEATVRRSNTKQRIAIGCDESGNINTMIHETVSSNLPEAKFFEPAGLSTHFLYKGENRLVTYKMVDMNWVLAGSMRAPGEAVGQVALECAMDEMAEKLGLDPVEFRLRNEPEKDPSKDVPFSTRTLIPCMKQAADAFGWAKRSPKPASRLEGDWWIGMGMAVASRGNQLAPSEARVTLKLDNTATYGVKVVVETDMTDIGTGSYTVFTQVVAELLGLPTDHIEMVLGDTDLPSGSGSGGSVGASSTGSSIYLACEELRLLIAKKVGIYADTLRLEAGQISKVGEHNPTLTEAALENAREAGNTLLDKAKTELKHRLSGDMQTTLKDTLHSAAKKISGAVKALQEDSDLTLPSLASLPTSPIPDDTDEFDFDNFKSFSLKEVLGQFEDHQVVAMGQIMPGKNKTSYRQASYGANFAEVAVNRVTGEIRVHRMTGAFSAGRILNRKTATSQCYGGMVFGIGSALMEEIIHDKNDGRICNHDLAEYEIPVNADVPQLDVILVEEDDSYTNPMHTKGIGETAISGAAAAIANAVYNAVGVRVYDFPITLDKILAQMPDSAIQL